MDSQRELGANLLSLTAAGALTYSEGWNLQVVIQSVASAARCASCEQRRLSYRKGHNTSPIWLSADCMQIEQPVDDEDGRRGL